MSDPTLRTSAGAASALPAIAASRQTPVGAIDLAIALDRTASSIVFQKGIGFFARIFLSEIERLSPSARCWVQSHGDEDFGERPELLTDGESPAQALDDIRRVSYVGGGDLPETHSSAIERILDLVPWRSASGRGTGILLFLGTHETKPAASGRSAREIGREIRRRGILFYALCEPTDELRRLVRSARGVLLPISNDPPREKVEELARAACRSVRASVGRPGGRQ